MTKINENFLKLKAGYLFPEIAKRVKQFQEKFPEKELIKLGIGDVVKPLPPEIIQSFKSAVDEMAIESSFKGYGPEQGYEFLREAIAKNNYQKRNCSISPDEIFISDGSKCDTGNIVEIFAHDSKIAVSDPVYPVYVDTNVMYGRTGLADDHGKYQGIVYMSCTEENNFFPQFPKERVDLVYLCFPNNPTGSSATKEQLAGWIEWAKENDALILFDAAYEAFISEGNIPHSIYEVPGAEEVAIEFCSFSKNAGFTGTRCAWTVVPKSIRLSSSKGEVELHSLWNRRQSTKFNGVSYPVQKAAASVYTTEGQSQVKELVKYYMENAKIIRKSLQKIDLKVYGGINAPYVWVKTPNISSWDFFDMMLKQAGVVGTPGSGFGPSGEGFFSL